jgi:hypothetical protein
MRVLGLARGEKAPGTRTAAARMVKTGQSMGMLAHHGVTSALIMRRVPMILGNMGQRMGTGARDTGTRPRPAAHYLNRPINQLLIRAQSLLCGSQEEFGQLLGVSRKTAAR